MSLGEEFLKFRSIVMSSKRRVLPNDTALHVSRLQSSAYRYKNPQFPIPGSDTSTLQTLCIRSDCNHLANSEPTSHLFATLTVQIMKDTCMSLLSLLRLKASTCTETNITHLFVSIFCNISIFNYLFVIQASLSIIIIIIIRRRRRHAVNKELSLPTNLLSICLSANTPIPPQLQGLDSRRNS
jgi:hypothetical protein